MRPDLFAGPALRDDRYRILARLANGGSVPVPARQWLHWNRTQRARLAAVATLLATAGAAWVWLQNGQSLPSESTVLAARPGMAPSPAVPAEPAPQQPATIENAEMPPTESLAVPPRLAGARPQVLKPLHGRPAKAAAPSRRQPGPAAAPESDEDVTLLAAMLKHAKPQQSSPTPPKD